MANETVVIDVIAKFTDKVTGKTKKAQNAVNKLENTVNKLGKKKANVHIGVKDKASSGLQKVLSKAKGFARKSYKSTLAFLDKASSVVKSVMNKAKSFVSKPWKATLSAVDRFTSPLTKLKNMLFNINTLIAAVATGLATKLVVANPISQADTITTSTIFFETKLGSAEKANTMMSNIMNFAKDTPFDTQGVIDGVKTMMAYGIETKNVMTYMEKIGNVTSALGAGEAGIESITRALGQMKAAGRVNAQDMMQLTSVGVSGWQYIADGMGKTVAQVRKMSEDGELAADEAIKHIMNGLSEYDGMMDKMSNTTVSGIASNIKDAFDQSIVLKWGQGLQKGAVNGLQNVKTWLDRIDPMLSRAGTSLEEMGYALSTKVFDGLGSLQDRITESISSVEFKEADIGGKIKILWDDVIWTPFSEWWNNKGKPKLTEKMAEFGYSLGTGISNGLLTILGFDVYGTIDEGASIGASFAKGFSEGFDGEAVGDAIYSAIKKAFSKGTGGLFDLLLPGNQGASSSDKLIGALMGYGGLKLFGGSIWKGAKGLTKKLWGTPGNEWVRGTGLSSKFATVGYKLHGTNAGMYYGGASTISAKAATAVGAGSVAGGIVGGATLLKGGNDLYRAYKAYKDGDSTEAKARLASGGTAIGGVAAGALAGGKIGAAIGTVGGPIGTAAGALIGAGVGGIAGWIGGEKWAASIRASKAETEELQEAIKDTSLSAEDLNEVFTKSVQTNLAEHFGDVALSLEEISTLAKRITFGDNEKLFESFSTAASEAAVKLEELQNSTSTLNKMNWKASLGLKLSTDDQESYKAAVESYLADAEEFIESKHYEMTCAVDLLIGSDSTEGKSILKTSDAFYAGVQKELDTLGSELSSKVKIALKDGIIDIDEQAEIANLQKQIAEITAKMSEAETEAEFDLIKLKFGKGELDSESFSELQSQLQEQVESATGSYDEALKVSLTSLNLQLDEGAIDQETYDEQLSSLMEGYDANIEELNAKVQGIQLELLGDAYSDVLGDESKEKLQTALESSLKDGIDPIAWTQEDAMNYLGVESLSTEAAGALSECLSQVAASIPETISTSMSEAMGEVSFESAVPVLQSALAPLPGSLAASITPESYSVVRTNLESSVGSNIEGVDVSGPAATMKSNCDSTVQGAMSSGVSVSYPITINPYLTKSSFTISGAGASQTVSFSIGRNAAGGFINGRTLSWLAEEGYPEMVIPFAPHRRDRALSLWEKTGEMLGVKPEYNALGGIVGASYSETPSSNPSIATYERESKGNIQLTIGNITFEIKAGDNPSDILTAIKAQKEAIVDLVSEALYEALLTQFGNTPMAAR